jgi:hypothetical protein
MRPRRSWAGKLKRVPFAPMTLGRVHAARELPMGDEILTLPDLSFMAVEVELIESRLHKRGAQYHMLYRARLGGG